MICFVLLTRNQLTINLQIFSEYHILEKDFLFVCLVNEKCLINLLFSYKYYMDYLKKYSVNVLKSIMVYFSWFSYFHWPCHTPFYAAILLLTILMLKNLANTPFFLHILKNQMLYVVVRLSDVISNTIRPKS